MFRFIPMFIRAVKLHALELSGMLSMRNTDPKYSISIQKADYYNSKGELKPLLTRRYQNIPKAI